MRSFSCFEIQQKPCHKGKVESNCFRQLPILPAGKPRAVQINRNVIGSAVAVRDVSDGTVCSILHVHQVELQIGPNFEAGVGHVDAVAVADNRAVVRASGILPPVFINPRVPVTNVTRMVLHGQDVDVLYPSIILINAGPAPFVVRPSGCAVGHNRNVELSGCRRVQASDVNFQNFWSLRSRQRLRRALRLDAFGRKGQQQERGDDDSVSDTDADGGSGFLRIHPGFLHFLEQRPFLRGFRVAVFLLRAWRMACVKASIFSKARFPCGAGLEVPLANELTKASTILCIVFMSNTNNNRYFTCQNGAYGYAPGRGQRSIGKKRGMPHLFPLNAEGILQSPRHRSPSYSIRQAPQSRKKRTPIFR